MAANVTVKVLRKAVVDSCPIMLKSNFLINLLVLFKVYISYTRIVKLIYFYLGLLRFFFFYPPPHWPPFNSYWTLFNWDFTFITVKFMHYINSTIGFPHVRTLCGKITLCNSISMKAEILQTHTNTHPNAHTYHPLPACVHLITASLSD